MITVSAALHISSDQGGTGHGAGAVNPPQVTRSGHRLCIAACETMSICGGVILVPPRCQGPLLDDLVSLQENFCRHIDAERLCSLEIEHRLEAR
jgi:hypothetical protein